MRWPASSNRRSFRRWSDFCRVSVLWDLMGRQLVLHRLKQALVDDRRLFPRQDLAPVVDLANKELVTEKVGEGAPAERNAAAGVARRPEGSRPGADVFGLEVAREFVDPADLQ